MAERGQQVAIPAPVAELVAAWNDRVADRFVAVLAPDVRVAVPPLHLELQGREDVRLGVSRLFGAFGALRYTTRHRYLTPDGVTDEALLEGLQTQDFLGAPPPGHPGAVAARIMMQHDGYVVTRLEVWPDVAALRELSAGMARRIDLRSSGPAGPVVAALRATIPAPASKVSFGQHRQQPVTAVAEGTLLPGAADAEGLAQPGGAGQQPEGTGGHRVPVQESPAWARPKAEVPKAPLPRRVRRVRAFLAGVVMLAVAGLLVAYVVQGVRGKQAADAQRPKPSPTSAAPRATTSKPAASSSKPPAPKLDPRTNTFSFSVSLLFNLNSYKLRPDARSSLESVVQQVLSERRYGVIDVRGYTDNTGTPQLNLVLSQRRADAVAAYLTQRLPPAHFQVRSFGEGENDPKFRNDTPAHQAQNRRVEIKVPPKPKS